MSIISRKAFYKIDNKERCPECEKETIKDDFPEYTFPNGGGGWGAIFQCTKCGYTTSILDEE